MAKIRTDEKVEFLDSGLPQLNKLMGGGYPIKYLTMVSGQGGVGKTSTAVQAIVKAQEKGIKTLYVETDFKFVPSYFTALGIDFNYVTVLQGEVGEDLLHEMIKEIETGEYGFVVLDTVSKLTPREEVEKDFDSHTIGKQAMLIGRFLRKLKPLANRFNMAVVLLNHERENIMTGGITTPGGKAIQEDVVIWVRMSHTGDNLAQSGVIVGKKIKAKIWRKNQVAPTEGHEVVLEIYSGKGFSAVADVINEGIEKGVLRKEGNTYYMGDLKLGVGLGKARTAIEESKELQEKLSGLLK